MAGETAPPESPAAELKVTHGPVNSAIVEREGKTLAIYAGPEATGPAPELLLLVEARRDVTWGASTLAQKGTRIFAPEKEADLLRSPSTFWAELREKRFHDYAQQSTKVLPESIPIVRTVKEGDTVDWRDVTVRVLETPGYTRGAVSYIVELGGKKVAFIGDLIRDDGKLQDLFSLQDAIREAKVGGYHGWAGRLGELITSLDKIAAEKPDLLVPLRGPVIHDPPAAIDRLKTRIRAVYANYLSIDALRWYFKNEHILAKAKRVMKTDSIELSEAGRSSGSNGHSQVEVMPMAETLPLPAQIVPISNSRLILAADGSGFLVDCGGSDIIEKLRKLREQGKLTSLEHVFVTHYHDDHTDALPKLVTEFGAKVHACGGLVNVLEHPGEYRLPCLTKNPIQVTASHRDGEKWKWKEYQLTIFNFPGQTLYHNALLVQQGAGWGAFFAGDSFTPSGIDDYCLQNRNFLHEGQGFFRCLDQLEKLPIRCMILNQHVEPAFRFSAPQISYMRKALQKRIPLLRELLPFDDPNFGLDESWAVLHPHWITVQPGGTAKIALRVTNHSAGEQTFRAGLHAPAGFKVNEVAPIRVGAHAEGALEISVQVPANINPGLHVLTSDIAWETNELREWAEAVIEVVR